MAALLFAAGQGRQRVGYAGVLYLPLREDPSGASLWFFQSGGRIGVAVAAMGTTAATPLLLGGGVASSFLGAARAGSVFPQVVNRF